MNSETQYTKRCTHTDTQGQDSTARMRGGIYTKIRSGHKKTNCTRAPNCTVQKRRADSSRLVCKLTKLKFFFFLKKRGLSFTRVQRRQNSGTCENEVGSCRGRLQWEQGREVIIQCKITGIQWNEAISGACILSLTALWERYLMIMNGPWNRVDYLRGEIENKKNPANSTIFEGKVVVWHLKLTYWIPN